MEKNIVTLRNQIDTKRNRTVRNVKRATMESKRAHEKSKIATHLGIAGIRIQDHSSSTRPR